MWCAGEFVGSLDKTVRLWRPETGECIHVLMQTSAPPFCIRSLFPTLTNRGEWLSATREGTLTFWKGTALRKTIELNMLITSVTEAPRHEILLVGTGRHPAWLRTLVLLEESDPYKLVQNAQKVNVERNSKITLFGNHGGLFCLSLRRTRRNSYSSATNVVVFIREQDVFLECGIRQDRFD